MIQLPRTSMNKDVQLTRELLIAGHKIGGSHSRERDGKCYRYVCDSTCKRPTRTEVECTPPTTTPPTTTTCACHHEGRMYQPGEKLQGSESRERNGKCYDYVCDSTCRRPTRREVTCTPTTPTSKYLPLSKRHATTPTTITTCACHHEGREYLAATTPPTTTTCACHHEGRMYQPGEKLQGSESRERNGKCYDYVCDSTCRRPTRREVTCTSTTPTS
ncbi:kielin/chordin-like protein [Xenopus laevis]|uniref:Kielin/chordin-like protein n=1 Tax=Xenopus laevis TaxID=8355 RepID=A0A8J1MX12_XENLA|nr:kielin/chordin-like protein [Xenopus laevis]